MKNLIIILFFIPFVSFGQSLRSIGINSYKYIVIDEISGSNKGETRRFVVKNLKKAGYKIVNLKKPLKTHESLPEDIVNNPDLGIYLTTEVAKRGCYIITTKLSDYYGNLKLSREGSSCFLLSTGVKNSLSSLTSYDYKYKPVLQEKKIIKNALSLSIDFSSEKSIRDYIDTLDNIEEYEGIYRYSSASNNSSQYKFLILKEDYSYNGYIIEANCIGCQGWRRGDVKFQMTEGAVEGLFDVSWEFPKGEKKRANKILFTSKYNGALLDAGDFTLMKLYPKLKTTKKRSKSGEWAGNGSGLIISKSGYIITNNHVIEDADDIEVEFIINGKVRKFNAEIVQVDKTNDLAVLKIFDMEFDGLSDLPYNFKTRSSDVGTKVYAYGYPMALSIMGKEIKVTDGIISAKTGFNGNITTYQITAPIQGGNSGGPLFDNKGNFLGINSSGLRKDVADNVGYTIKSSYVLNLLDVLPKTIDLPINTKLKSLPLTEQIKEISKYVVLVKVK
tara:strand:+ start:51 stop:1556 length:1506 start_codon:yes stop_codon:yes gene_type:complete